MAKNTLSFTNTPSYEDFTLTASTIVPCDSNLWYGSVVTLNQSKLEIVSFGGASEVKVILKSTNITGLDAGVVVKTLTPESPTFDGTGTLDGTSFIIPSAEYYLAVDTAHKDAKISYNIESANITASIGSSNSERDEITVGDVVYAVDAETFETPLKLDKGDKITLTGSGAETMCLLLSITESIYPGSAVDDVFELLAQNNYSYTATRDNTYIKIATKTYYAESGLSRTYKVTHYYEDTQSTTVPGTELYADTSKKFVLHNGYTLENTGSDPVVLVRENGSVAGTLAENDSFSSVNNETIYVASSTSGASVAYKVTAPAPKEHKATYSGKSGICQIKKKYAGDWLRVYGDAGLGYMFIGEPDGDGSDVIFHLNMDGFNSMKFVCSGEVVEGCVNEV